MRYIKEFDSLRAIAVIMVMLGHYLSQHYFLRVLSSVGVILFFVLSGFLITQILLQQKEKI